MESFIFCAVLFLRNKNLNKFYKCLLKADTSVT